MLLREGDNDYPLIKINFTASSSTDLNTLLPNLSFTNGVLKLDGVSQSNLSATVSQGDHELQLIGTTEEFVAGDMFDSFFSNQSIQAQWAALMPLVSTIEISNLYNSYELSIYWLLCARSNSIVKMYNCTLNLSAQSVFWGVKELIIDSCTFYSTTLLLGLDGYTGVTKVSITNSEFYTSTFGFNFRHNGNEISFDLNSTTIYADLYRTYAIINPNVIGPSSIWVTGDLNYSKITDLTNIDLSSVTSIELCYFDSTNGLKIKGPDNTNVSITFTNCSASNAYYIGTCNNVTSKLSSNGWTVTAA